MPRSHAVQYLDEESRIQIPMELLAQIGVSAGDSVELLCQDGAIMLRKSSPSECPLVQDAAPQTD